jgi:adenylate cyclase
MKHSATSDGDHGHSAAASYLQRDFAPLVAALIGEAERLADEARHQALEDSLPDLSRIRSAATHLAALVASVVAAETHQHPFDAADRHKLRHDLRSPLNAVRGYAELLIESAEDDGRTGLVSDLNRMIEHAADLLGKIDRFGELLDSGETAYPDAVRRLPSSAAVKRALHHVRDAAVAERHAAVGLKGRILIVDDSAVHRDLLARRLERAGHDVSIAENGIEALGLTIANGFDLVLLDMMMPGMTGLEVLKRLQADPATRDIPVIMVSANDELSDVVRCIEAGAVDYLSKPVNPVLLKARTTVCLEHKRMRDRELVVAEELRAEKELSDALLHHILPTRIVERIRGGESLIADHIATATMLFSDMVDFTSLSARMQPEEVIELLDLLFSRFDAIAHRLGLEKIKTIGDGYMVAGGLPDPRADHAVAVAEMALAMHAAAAMATRAMGELGRKLQLRIGIHSGPLVAGVIGTHKFVYDVWGDTVNTASRMEKYGEPGRIHVSAATRALLGDAFDFVPRGTVEVKGKGGMETFFLERKSRRP